MSVELVVSQRGSRKPLYLANFMRLRIPPFLKSDRDLSQCTLRSPICLRRNLHSYACTVPAQLEGRKWNGLLPCPDFDKVESRTLERMVKWYAKQKQSGTLCAKDISRLTNDIFERNNRLCIQQVAALFIGSSSSLTSVHDRTPEFLYRMFHDFSLEKQESLISTFIQMGKFPAGLPPDATISELLLVAPSTRPSCVVLGAILMANPTFLAGLSSECLALSFQLGVSIPEEKLWKGSSADVHNGGATFRKRWISFGEKYVRDLPKRMGILREAGLCFEATVAQGQPLFNCGKGKRTAHQVASSNHSSHLDASPALWEPPRDSDSYKNGGFGSEVLSVVAQPTISIAALQRACQGMPPSLHWYTMHLALLSWARNAEVQPFPKKSEKENTINDLDNPKLLPRFLVDAGVLSRSQLLHTLHFGLKMGGRTSAELLLADCRSRGGMSKILQYTRNAGLPLTFKAMLQWRSLFSEDELFAVLYLRQTGRNAATFGSVCNDRDSLLKYRSHKSGMTLVVQVASTDCSHSERPGTNFVEKNTISSGATHIRPSLSRSGFSVPRNAKDISLQLQSSIHRYDKKMRMRVARQHVQSGNIKEALTSFLLACQEGLEPDFSLVVNLMVSCVYLHEKGSGEMHKRSLDEGETLLKEVVAFCTEYLSFNVTLLCKTAIQRLASIQSNSTSEYCNRALLQLTRISSRIAHCFYVPSLPKLPQIERSLYQIHLETLERRCCGGEILSVSIDALKDLLSCLSNLHFEVIADVIAHGEKCAEISSLHRAENDSVDVSSCWWWSSIGKPLDECSLDGSVTPRLYQREVLPLWPLAVKELTLIASRNSSFNSVVHDIDKEWCNQFRNTRCIHQAIRLAAAGCDDFDEFFRIFCSAWNDVFGEHENGHTLLCRRSFSKTSYAYRRWVAGEEEQWVRTIFFAVEALCLKRKATEALQCIPAEKDLPLPLQFARFRCCLTGSSDGLEAFQTFSKNMLKKNERRSSIVPYPPQHISHRLVRRRTTFLRRFRLREKAFRCPSQLPSSYIKLLVKAKNMVRQ